MIENPFLFAREAFELTQVEVAERCDVTPAFIMKIEQGLFRSIPKKVVTTFLEQFNLAPTWIHQYRRFQLIRRREASRPIGGKVVIRPLPLTFTNFRLDNWPQLSKSQWCKEFCIHPASLYAIESGEQLTLPNEMKNALLDSGVMTSLEVEQLKRAIVESKVEVRSEV